MSYFVARALCALFCALAAVSAFACMWDSDTLANEAKRKPGVVEACIGWFERNPPLYFEMRLKRAAEDIQKDPTNLEAYDDAAVACDRLGNDPDAIKWMDRKEVQLAKLDIKDPKVKDHFYRLHANRGTFWVHGWLRTGSPKERISEVEKSISDLEKAIKINPNAHFGREIVQVEVIRAMYLSIKENAAAGLDSWTAAQKRLGDDKIRQGLVGMVFMGNAWESPDVYRMIVNTCGRDAAVAYIAQLREEELVTAGKKYGFPKEFQGNYELRGRLEEVREAEIKKIFKVLRAKSDAYHDGREEFMLARLKEGRHPDTDPSFWDGYKEPKIPDLRKYFEAGVFLTPVNVIFGVAIGLVTLVVGVFVFGGSRRRKARRRKARIGRENP